MGPEPASLGGTLPSGTIVFLFTDVEGSTQRWDRYREAMQAALRRHDELVRAAIVRNGGHVFKTIGDAFCAAFPSAAGAVRAALDAQLDLAAADFEEVDGLRVRMALHAGSADERDGDYFGQTLNRVARLLAVAHGGQVLISTAAAQLASENLPPGARLDDLGRVRLKDLSVAEHVFALNAAGLRSAFPPLRSLDATPNNLPERVASFVGRSREIREIRDALSKARVVTIAGTGGVGKTQCALQVAAESLEGFTDGVWLVELATRDAEGTIPAMLAALGLAESSRRSGVESLTDFLRGRAALLIIDNCEHVLDVLAPAVETLAASCPSLRVLATSREALRVRGESVYRLPPLSGEESVALFVERAVAADSQFVLTPENEPIVADICRRLDGLALAIELAAARVRLLPVPQLARRLDDRLRLLSGGRRTDQPRQQTVHALIDWSYQLLSPEERRWFRGLSIFQSGFSVASAAAVCGLGERDEFDALEALTSLVEKSLVVADPEAERFHLLESLRAFGRQRLADECELPATTLRHAEWVLDFHREMGRREGEEPHGPWRARLEVEFEELRAALQWAAGENGNPELAARLVVATISSWLYFAPREGMRRLTAVRDARRAVEPELEAQLTLHEARLSLRGNKWIDALRLAETAVEQFGRASDADGKREALRQQATALVALGRYEEAERITGPILSEFRERKNLRMTNACLHILAVARDEAGDFEACRRLFEEASEFAATAGNDQDAADIADNFSIALNRAGRHDEALEQNARALALRRALRDRNTLPLTLNNRAEFCLTAERFSEAREAGLAAVAAAADVGWKHQRSLGYFHAALAALKLEQGTAAARFFALANILCESEDARHLETEYAGLRAQLEGLLGESVVAQALDEAELELRGDPRP